MRWCRALGPGTFAVCRVRTMKGARNNMKATVTVTTARVEGIDVGDVIRFTILPSTRSARQSNWLRVAAVDEIQRDSMKLAFTFDNGASGASETLRKLDVVEVQQRLEVL